MAAGKSTKASSKKKKEKEVIPLDDMTLTIARELFKHFSILNLEINGHINKKTIILNQKELNENISINLKLSGFNEVKKLDFILKDNDEIELIFEIEKYTGRIHESKVFKLKNGFLNSEEGFLEFTMDFDNNHKINEISSNIFLFLNKYIFKHIFSENIINQFEKDNLLLETEKVLIDFKNGSFKPFYEKNINQILNTKVPYFGDKKITDMFEIECILCEKEQMWIDISYKLI